MHKNLKGLENVRTISAGGIENATHKQRAPQLLLSSSGKKDHIATLLGFNSQWPFARQMFYEKRNLKDNAVEVATWHLTRPFTGLVHGLPSSLSAVLHNSCAQSGDGRR
jgi:hypothetical protein